MHRFSGLILVTPLAFAAEVYDKKVMDKLAERVLALRPTQESSMDSTMLAKNYPSKIHGNRHLMPMLPGQHSSVRSSQASFLLPHGPSSSLLPASPLQVSHALSEHQGDDDPTGRRHLISGLAATVAAASILGQVTPPALAAEETFQLTQQLAVLDKLIAVLADATTAAKTQADLAAKLVKSINEKGAGADKDQAATAEREIAVSSAFAAVVAKTAGTAAAKVESLAANEITRSDIEAFSEAGAKAIRENAGLPPTLAVTEIRSSAGLAKLLIFEAGEALKSASEYATASAKAIPRVTVTKKKGSKEKDGVKDDRAAVAVAVVAGEKAQAALTTAEAKIAEATIKICRAPNFCGLVKAF